MSRLALIQVTGKRNRVPVILTIDMRAGIDLIVHARIDYVPEENPFVFALPKSTKGSYEGWTSLKHITSNLPELKNPETITSTRLRKYVATISQVIFEVY